MDFLNHREVSMVFYQVFLLLLYSAQNFTVEIRKRLREFEKCIRCCVSLKKYTVNGGDCE